VPYFWKKSLKQAPATFNARAETVAEKPMFRDAFKRRRCIIPASGFFEWTDEADGKQPHLFTAVDGSPILAFAGLWDRWIDPASKEELLSCTVIVSGASAWMTTYHDRMPALLRGLDFDAWLDGSLGPEALRPAAESALREWPVSRRVNRTGRRRRRSTIIREGGDGRGRVVRPQAWIPCLADLIPVGHEFNSLLRSNCFPVRSRREFSG